MYFIQCVCEYVVRCSLEGLLRRIQDRWCRSVFFWGSASSLGSGGESDLILYLPAHVSYHVVNLPHQPRFNKDSSTLR